MARLTDAMRAKLQRQVVNEMHKSVLLQACDEESVKITLTFSSLTDLTAAADLLNAAGLTDKDLIDELLDDGREVEWRIVGDKDRVPFG